LPGGSRGLGDVYKRQGIFRSNTGRSFNEEISREFLLMKFQI
jgi:hypothetical protein